jgi:GTP cyclohydrolase I
MIGERPTKQQAEEAVRTLLRYIGEDANREGMRATPSRVIKSYDELFSGYKVNIEEILNTRFYDISNFNDIVLLKSINFSSSCEHHMLPFTGSVDIAYLPDGFVVGISKLARLVDAFSKRLQIQEKMTANIAEALDTYLKPRGVAVRVAATHSCMTSRGTMKAGSILESTHFTGVFKDQAEYRREFWHLVKG